MRELKEYSNKRELKHLIKHTLKKYAPLLIINFLVMMLLMPLSNVIAGRLQNIVKNGYNTGYSLYNLEFIVGPVVIFTSIISAYVCFRFLFSRSAQAAYFLSGVSRLSLFAVTYIFGLCSIAVPVTLALGVSCVINLIMLPGFAPLIPNTLYVLGMLISLSLVSYSISVMIMTLCGRGLDFYISTVTAHASGYIFLLLAANFGSSFLLGMPYTSKYSTYGHGYYDMFARYKSLSLPSVFMIELTHYGTVFVPKEQYALGQLAKNFPRDVQKIFVLIVLGVIFTALALWFFKTRDAVKAQKPNATLPFMQAVNILISASAASLVFIVLDAGFSSFLLFLLVFFFCYAMFSAVFNGTPSRVFEEYKVPIGASLASILLCVILLTGGFGYSGYTPDSEDVESVQISYEGNPYVVGNKVYSNGFNYRIDYLFTLTAPEDISTAIGIHESIIDDGSRAMAGDVLEDFGNTVVETRVSVSYKLKNGRVVDRCYYNLKMSTLTELLALDTTEKHEELLLQKLTNSMKGSIAVSDNAYANITELNLTGGQRAALIDAIMKDKSNDSVEEIYFPKKECLGVIIATSENGEDYGTRYSYDKYALATKTFVYESDVYTIAVLKELGAYDAMLKSYTVEEMYIADYPVFPGNGWYKGYACHCFVSDVSGNQCWYLEGKTILPESEHQRYLNDARLMYYANGGKILIIKTVNEEGEIGIIAKYLPK